MSEAYRTAQRELDFEDCCFLLMQKTEELINRGIGNMTANEEEALARLTGRMGELAVVCKREIDRQIQEYAGRRKD